MPRRSVASRAFAVRSSAEQLKAPAELTAAEKRIWIAIVADRKAEHFVASDEPLLSAYVHAIAQ
jgi:hypothetical protein